MKLIPISSDIFSDGKVGDLEAYYLNNKKNFSHMWEEQGPDYWIRFMISLEQHIKKCFKNVLNSTHESRESLRQIADGPAAFALNVITNGLIVKTAKNILQLMDDIWIVTKYNDEFPMINTSCGKIHSAAIKHLYGDSNDSSIYAVKWFMHFIYLVAASALCQTCIKFENATQLILKNQVKETYWCIPKCWFNSQYQPSRFEMYLLSSRKAEFLALLREEKQTIPWTNVKLPDAKPQSFNLSITFKTNVQPLIDKMPGVKRFHRRLFDVSLVLIDKLKTAKYGPVNIDEIRFHPANEVLSTQFSIVFGSRFQGILRKEVECLIDRSKWQTAYRFEQGVKQLSALLTFSESWGNYACLKLDVESADEFNAELRIPASFDDGDESDVSCSSLLSEERRSDVDLMWDMGGPSYACSPPILDRLPWDIPLVMAFQDELNKSAIKVGLLDFFYYTQNFNIWSTKKIRNQEFRISTSDYAAEGYAKPLENKWQMTLLELAMLPLVIYPISTKSKPTVEKLSNFIKEVKFLLHFSMLVADYIAWLEGLDNYQWPQTIDLRKYLHESGYRLRFVWNFLDTLAYDHPYFLLENEWPSADRCKRSYSQTSVKTKWEVTQENCFLDVEELFVDSPRHFSSWLNDEDFCAEKMSKIFPVWFEKLKDIKLSKETLDNGFCAKEKSKVTRWELNCVEAAIAKKVKVNYVDLNIRSLCQGLVNAQLLPKEHCDELFIRMKASKVPSDALSFIKDHGAIFSSYHSAKKQMAVRGLETDRVSSIMMSFGVTSFTSVCKINLAVQELIHSSRKYTATPPANILSLAESNVADDLLYRDLNVDDIEDEIMACSDELWCDSPITQIPPHSVPDLKEEDSFISSRWKTESVRHWAVVMEKNRTQLIRTVVDKYFSTLSDAKNVSLFPYWYTLVSFMRFELYSLVELDTRQPRQACWKVLQLINYRMLWMRKQIEEWENNSNFQRVFPAFDEDELLIRCHLAENSLRDVFNSRLSKREHAWPVSSHVLHSRTVHHRLLRNAMSTTGRFSNLTESFMLDCYLKYLQEMTDYLEKFTEHAGQCWNYRSLEFHPGFKENSFEHCESVIFAVKRLQYMCLPLVFASEKLLNDRDSSIRRIHVVEKMLVEQKSSSNVLPYTLTPLEMFTACRECWLVFKEFYSDFAPKIIAVPHSFYVNCITFTSILVCFKRNQLNEVQELLRITNTPGPTRVLQFLDSTGFRSAMRDIKDDLDFAELTVKEKIKKKDDDTNLFSNIMVQGFKKMFESSSKTPEKKPAAQEMKCDHAKAKPNATSSTAIPSDICAEGIRKMFVTSTKKPNDEALPKAASKKTNEKKSKDEAKANVKEDKATLKTEAVKLNVEPKTSNSVPKIVRSYEKPQVKNTPINVNGSTKISVTSKDNNKYEREDVNKDDDIVQHLKKLIPRDKDRGKYCAFCKDKEPEGVKYKKCQRCKDEHLSNPKFYCGRSCQMKDWEECHRQEHLRQDSNANS